MKLAQRRCEPCTAGGIPLSHDEAEELHREIPDWILNSKELRREFDFKNFRQAMKFVNRVAEVAEEQGHHPDIFIYYNKVKLVLSTHKIGGLSDNDFILAARIGELLETAELAST
jgi:4a-hydroxytetrahydrobiopterin dehydratase